MNNTNVKYSVNIVLILILAFSCSTKKENLDKNPEIIPEEKIEENFDPGDPFYPLKESISDLQYQIHELKARVTEYESTLHAPSLNAEILKLIKAPLLRHEILMENGTIIQGSIIQETADQLIVQTQIGQLKIDKAFVNNIKDIDPLHPEININEETVEEKISSNNLTFTGTLTNEGGRRGDFIRVIYHLWENDTAPILTDSTFITGNTIKYINGVISDASLDPGQTGTYTLSINIPDSINVTYWTKKVRANIFE